MLYLAILDSLNESDIDGSGEVADDSETDPVTDIKSDTDSDIVDSQFDGDIEWRNSPSPVAVDHFTELTDLNHHLSLMLWLPVSEVVTNNNGSQQHT